MQVVSGARGATFTRVLRDAIKGRHLFTNIIPHVPLHEPSSLLTTFNTPVGRMKWNRIPFGISVAPEEFQRRIDESLEGLEGTKAIANDILIWGDDNTITEATSNYDA